MTLFALNNLYLLHLFVVVIVHLIVEEVTNLRVFLKDTAKEVLGDLVKLYYKGSKWLLRKVERTWVMNLVIS